MPLVTDDIFQARSAFNALEARTLIAEQNVSLLKETITTLSAGQQTTAHAAQALKDFSVGQLQSNSQLVVQQAKAVSPDIPLDSFIAALGMAAALGEASLIDRVIPSLQVTIQGYLTFDADPNSGSRVVGLRFYQPELGSASVLATTSFEISKVTPPSGATAPRTLYAVIQDLQAVFSDPFWTRFAASSPSISPAASIVAATAQIFDSVGSWTFEFLIQQAEAIASFETTLVSLLGGAAPPERITAFRAVAVALSNLTQALAPSVRTTYVAGDLYALSATLDATTQIAKTLMP